MVHKEVSQALGLYFSRLRLLTRPDREKVVSVESGIPALLKNYKFPNVTDMNEYALAMVSSSGKVEQLEPWAANARQGSVQVVALSTCDDYYERNAYRFSIRGICREVVVLGNNLSQKMG